MAVVDTLPQQGPADAVGVTRIQGERRQQLIESAIAVIGEEGLSQLTLAKVAGRAGLSPAMVNFHFKTKSDLLLATLRGLAEEFQERVEGAVALSPDDPTAQLEALIDANFDPSICGAHKVAVWYAFWGESQARAEYQTACGETDAAYDRLAQRLVRAAAESTGAAVDSEALAQGLLGLIESQWQCLLADPQGFDRDRARALCRRYLAAVVPRRDVPRAPEPTAEASRRTRRLWTLPSWSYRHEELHAAELECLHRPAWQLICHVSQIPEPGDYRTLDLFGRRVFAVRDATGTIRAFDNVCRHRAHAVVEGRSGRCPGAIRCPYHGWTYDLDGRLRAMAAQSSFAKGAEGPQPERMGLRPIELEIFMGLVFIRLRPGGAPVAERLAPVAAELGHYRIEDMQPVGDWWQHEAPVDWKNVWDNYLEGYHFPTGHPGLDGLMRRAYSLETWPEARIARLWHALKDEPRGGWSERAYRRLLPRYEHLPAELETSWRYYLLFPSLAFDVYPDRFDFFQVIPVAPGRSLITSQSYALPDERREARAARWLNRRINGQVQLEDEALITSVQLGLESGSYQRGPLSEKELILGAFHDWIAAAVPAADLDRPPAAGSLAEINARRLGGAK